ncbi:hypothetical protein EK904_001888 [Melospiza melodia maxima]|nr:hypothetical protein EK904_001888 [Melospiza melodia maxima]
MNLNKQDQKVLFSRVCFPGLQRAQPVVSRAAHSNCAYTSVAHRGWDLVQTGCSEEAFQGRKAEPEMENEIGSFEEKPRKLLQTEGINRPDAEDFPLPRKFSKGISTWSVAGIYTIETILSSMSLASQQCITAQQAVKSKLRLLSQQHPTRVLRGQKFTQAKEWTFISKTDPMLMKDHSAVKTLMASSSILDAHISYALLNSSQPVLAKLENMDEASKTGHSATSHDDKRNCNDLQRARALDLPVTDSKQEINTLRCGGSASEEAALGYARPRMNKAP